MLYEYLHEKSVTARPSMRIYIEFEDGEHVTQVRIGDFYINVTTCDSFER